MKFLDYYKYGPWPIHALRCLFWKLAAVFNLYPMCIDCLENPCVGKSCFGSVRAHLKSINKLPTPDGYLAWRRASFQHAIFPKRYNPLSDPPTDWNLLKILRDGRSGSLMQEYAFNGVKNPYTNAILESDGSSHPADCWDKKQRNTLYEVKSFTAASTSLTLKSSGQTGGHRTLRAGSTLEDTILNYDFWIFVDRTEFYHDSRRSLPFYFLKSSDLLAALAGSYISKITDKPRNYVTSQQQVTEYETVLRVIHRAKAEKSTEEQTSN